MHSLLKDCLICPNCQATAEQGLQLELLKCARCDTCFFDLQGLPCFYPAGDKQKLRWQDLAAQLIAQAKLEDERHVLDMSRTAHTGSTRERLTRLYRARSQSYAVVLDLLHATGLQPMRDAAANAPLPHALADYVEIMLRNWGGQRAAGQDDLFTDGKDLNRQNLQAVIDALPKPLPATRRVLVVGAGAARLSWDLHCALKPQLTLAVESDPLLAYLAKHLVNEGGTLTLAETETHPHQNLPFFHSRQLWAPHASQADAAAWHVIGADPGHLPFAPGSFDLIVTAGFSDLADGDLRRWLATVEHLLNGAGVWVNSGYLSYPHTVPEAQQYSPAEVRELLQLGRFRMVGERFFAAACPPAPRQSKPQPEERWVFAAQAAAGRAHRQNGGVCNLPQLRASLPAWLILPHLPVPRLSGEGLFPDWMDEITQLLDGSRSVNDLIELLAPSMEEGQDAERFVYALFDEFVLQ